jgi:hypothetical protein
MESSSRTQSGDAGKHSSVAPHAAPIPNPKRPNGEPIPFAHPAEEAFAKLLDFYQTPWEYEPTTFPLEWDDQGRVTNAFSPDFYLADEDLYVELTTMKQSLVTRKNKKLRLLHKLYPEVRCKLIYRKDVASLAVKYGLFDEPELDSPVYNPRPLDASEDRRALLDGAMAPGRERKASR